MRWRHRRRKIERSRLIRGASFVGCLSLAWLRRCGYSATYHPASLVTDITTIKEALYCNGWPHVHAVNRMEEALCFSRSNGFPVRTRPGGSDLRCGNRNVAARACCKLSEECCLSDVIGPYLPAGWGMGYDSRDWDSRKLMAPHAMASSALAFPRHAFVLNHVSIRVLHRPYTSSASEVVCAASPHAASSLVCSFSLVDERRLCMLA
jgi:hypothetical protein